MFLTIFPLKSRKYFAMIHKINCTYIKNIHSSYFLHNFESVYSSILHNSNIHELTTSISFLYIILQVGCVSAELSCDWLDLFKAASWTQTHSAYLCILLGPMATQDIFSWQIRGIQKTETTNASTLKDFCYFLPNLWLSVLISCCCNNAA